MSAPSLHNAYLQIARGREHLNELKRFCSEIRAKNPDRIVLNNHGKFLIGPGETVDAGDIDATYDPTGDPVFERIAMLTGDVANCFRSALNYLTGQLAWLDSGSRKRGTQFLIEDSPAKFAGKRDSHLAGVSDEHVAVFEGLQPYSGSNWTGPLAKMSNVHKHDDLVVVSLVRGLNITHSTEHPTDGSPIHYKVHMQMRREFHVAIRDGRLPLVETLEVIEAQVTQLLDAFDPEFKG